MSLFDLKHDFVNNDFNCINKKLVYNIDLLRGRVIVTREAHNLEILVQIQTPQQLDRYKFRYFS